ncbi:MAG: hypothetical protein N2644_05990 [Candidatus Sumerlaea chitinivorans]|nr:hypothetical protein [Candidatus Sumerlaea chitinivorans]
MWEGVLKAIGKFQPNKRAFGEANTGSGMRIHPARSLKRHRRIAFVLLWLTLTPLGRAQVPWSTLPLPPRRADAPTGTQIRDITSSMSREVREAYIFDQIVSGNVPNFLRGFATITVTATLGGQPHTIQYGVTPDYLAVGSDTDFFRMPMTPHLAQWLCDRLGCSLPTRKMVNDIWAQSAWKLAPQPIAPSPEMVTVPVFYTHHQMVETQRQSMGAALGALLSGHKKDVVITPQLPTRPPPPRVAIYGWHYQNGTPIQPLSLVHEATYADYSHGIRLVKNEVVVDGQVTTLQAVLAHSTLAGLVSDEGAFSSGNRYPAPPPPALFPFSDRFTSAGRELSCWSDRFTSPTVLAFAPIAPGGDGYALRVRDPSGGIDSTRTGYSYHEDYFVESYIYCQYRPELATNGFERVGIFARDDGNGMFEGISGSGIKGNNYALTWDSHDGRVRCLRTVNGAATDLLPTPQYRASSGWRLFRIEVSGNSIAFRLDGELLLLTSDATHLRGQFGIGYHEYFANNANIAGTYAENFRADRLPVSSVTEWDSF